MDSQVLFEAHLRDTSRERGNVRFAHQLHPREAACGSGWRYWDHPVQLSQWLSQRGPSLQPRPCWRWFKQRSWRRLPDVLREFLGTSWVAGPSQRPWSEACDNYYYTFLHIIFYYSTGHYNILLRSLFLVIFYFMTLPIITYYYKFIITHYYIIITCLLHHNYIIITSLLHSLLLHNDYTMITLWLQ